MREAIAIAVAAAIAATGLAACTTHNCDPSTTNFDGGVVTHLDTGTMVWSSSPLTGPWLAFPANVTIQVTLPAGLSLVEYPSFTVGTSANPGSDGGGTSTPASGQLAETTNLSNTGFTLQNASCSDYFVYFSARVENTDAADAGGVHAILNDASDN